MCIFLTLKNTMCLELYFSFCLLIGNKKEKPGSEVLTLLLKSLETIVKSEVFPVSKTLVSIVLTC